MQCSALLAPWLQSPEFQKMQTKTHWFTQHSSSYESEDAANKQSKRIYEVSCSPLSPSQGDTQAPFNQPCVPRDLCSIVPLLLSTRIESLGEWEFNLCCAELFLVGTLQGKRSLRSQKGESKTHIPVSPSSEVNESSGLLLVLVPFPLALPKTRAAIFRIGSPPLPRASLRSNSYSAVRGLASSNLPLSEIAETTWHFKE